MNYPITVNKIEFKGELTIKSSLFHKEDDGKYVSIRCCYKGCDDKTYLGILLGDLPCHQSASFDEKTGTLTFETNGGNPAIWVPDLKRLVMGYESWWGVIESEEQLRQITNFDIENIWYVKVLKALCDEKQKVATS